MFKKIKQISQHNVRDYFKMISSPNFHLLGWCPAGPVLRHVEKVPLLPWLITVLVMVSQ